MASLDQMSKSIHIDGSFRSLSSFSGIATQRIPLKFS